MNKCFPYTLCKRHECTAVINRSRAHSHRKPDFRLTSQAFEGRKRYITAMHHSANFHSGRQWTRWNLHETIHRH